jgi:hypothetical protein
MQLTTWNEEDETKLNEVLGLPTEEPVDLPEEEIKPEIEEVEETPAAPIVPEVKPELVETPDHSAFARLRHEAAQAKRDKEEALAELERVKNPPVAIPSAEDDVTAHVLGKLGVTEKDLKDIKDWKDKVENDSNKRAIMNGAVNEFQRYENDFKAKTTDYEDVAEHFRNKLSESIRMVNPHFTNEEVNNETVRQTLIRASIASQQGINPVEALYNQGKAAGYQPKQDNDQEKSNLEILANNKKKSTNMLGTGSSGKPDKTLQSVANAPLSETGRLSEAEFEKLMGWR